MSREFYVTKHYTLEFKVAADCEADAERWTRKKTFDEIKNLNIRHCEKEFTEIVEVEPRGINKVNLCKNPTEEDDDDCFDDIDKYDD